MVRTAWAAQGGGVGGAAGERRLQGASAHLEDTEQRVARLGERQQQRLDSVHEEDWREAPLDAPESGSGRRLGGEGEADLGQVRNHVLSQPAAARRRAVPVAAAAAAGRVEVERIGEGDEADAGVRREGREDGGEGGEHRVDDGRGGGRLRHLEEEEERRRERRAGLVLWRRDELDGAAGELGPRGRNRSGARPE